jgi:hypothetical protein
MAARSAQLAIECTAPTVSEALMALALDYLKRASTMSEESQRQGTGEPADGFGD